MSNIPTVNVTARVYDQSGKPVKGAVVTMRLTTTERYGGYLVPKEMRAETDYTGKAVLAVWPNALGTEKSEYRVHIKYPHNGCESSCFNSPPGSVSGHAVVPNADCDLQNIMELTPTEYRGAGQVITSEVAMYAGQASSARDASQSLFDATNSVVGRADAAAKQAEAARDAAQVASLLAVSKSEDAEQLVRRAEDRIVYFEKEVVERVGVEATKLTTAATSAVVRARDASLTDIETRTTAVLTEITGVSVQLKSDAIASVERAKEQAIDALDKAKEDGLAAFHEEGELFREDFLQLSERAESAAKKAGCASIAAQGHANRACEAADRADRAAESVEGAACAAREAALAAERSKTCAEAASTEARIAASESKSARDVAVESARDLKNAVQTVTKSAIIAEQHAATAAVWKDHAAKSAGESKEAASKAEIEADRAKVYADDVEAAIHKVAVDLLTPQVVSDAVNAATATATTAAQAATNKAEEAKASSVESTRNANLAKQRADRADAALTQTEEIAAKMLKDYSMECHIVDLSTETIRLADRLTKLELGRPGAGSDINTGGTSLTLKVSEFPKA